MRLHHLLDGGADVAQARVDAGRRDARVRRLLDRRRQRVKRRVKVDRPGRVDNPAVDVRPKVDLADVAVLQHGLVARVRRPVRGDVVDRAPCREGDPRLSV